MESHITKILDIRPVTHDVLRIRVEKPAGYSFVPGQATEVAINSEQWQNERRPFTFTCLPGDEYLEFTIKTYPSHQGVTNQLRQLNTGDSLILHDVWGAISYKGEGLFIAGGAGITPFISILRSLHAQNLVGRNRLLFANKTKADIIYEDELRNVLGTAFVNVLSAESIPGFEHGYINEALLRDNMPDTASKIYLCGPPPMMDAIQSLITKMGISGESIVMEI